MSRVQARMSLVTYNKSWLKYLCQAFNIINIIFWSFKQTYQFWHYFCLILIVGSTCGSCNYFWKCRMNMNSSKNGVNNLIFSTRNCSFTVRSKFNNIIIITTCILLIIRSAPSFVIALKFSSSFNLIANSFLSLFVYIQISNFLCLFLVVISVIFLNQSTSFKLLLNSMKRLMTLLIRLKKCVGSLLFFIHIWHH